MRPRTRVFFTRKMIPFIASFSSALMMLLAFFIPSIQDQWDRYQSRKVIEQYVQLGDNFLSEENFKMAVEAYTKAYELSENSRLDIEVKRLKAKVNLVYQNPDWDTKPPEGLEEVDFQFLMHLQNQQGQEKELALTMTAYGIFLAYQKRNHEAETFFQKAIAKNPDEYITFLNYGNFLDQAGKKSEAITAYKKAISLDTINFLAHYNLGLLFAEQGKLMDAEAELSRAAQQNPGDSEIVRQHKLILKKILQK